MTIADKGVSDILRMLVPEEVPRFVPSPQGQIGRVCSCYDGDTVTLLCLIGGVPAQIALRILGVDAPERRGRGETERNAATAVRDVVEALVLNKILPVRITGVDKYGRALGDLELGDGTSLSEFLLHRGLARAYTGGCRRHFSPEELAEIVASAKSSLCYVQQCGLFEKPEEA
jgi:micrococcal nuclease